MRSRLLAPNLSNLHFDPREFSLTFDARDLWWDRDHFRLLLPNTSSRSLAFTRELKLNVERIHKSSTQGYGIGVFYPNLTKGFPHSPRLWNLLHQVREKRNQKGNQTNLNHHHQTKLQFHSNSKVSTKSKFNSTRSKQNKVPNSQILLSLSTGLSLLPSSFFSFPSKSSFEPLESDLVVVYQNMPLMLSNHLYL